jgi:hypothetical protein
MPVRWTPAPRGEDRRAAGSRTVSRAGLTPRLKKAVGKVWHRRGALAGHQQPAGVGREGRGRGGVADPHRGRGIAVGTADHCDRGRGRLPAGWSGRRLVEIEPRRHLDRFAKRRGVGTNGSQQFSSHVELDADTEPSRRVRRVGCLGPRGQHEAAGCHQEAGQRGSRPPQMHRRRIATHRTPSVETGSLPG